MVSQLTLVSPHTHPGTERAERSSAQTHNLQHPTFTAPQVHRPFARSSLLPHRTQQVEQVRPGTCPGLPLAGMQHRELKVESPQQAHLLLHVYRLSLPWPLSLLIWVRGGQRRLAFQQRSHCAPFVPLCRCRAGWPRRRCRRPWWLRPRHIFGQQSAHSSAAAQRPEVHHDSAGGFCVRAVLTGRLVGCSPGP